MALQPKALGAALGLLILGTACTEPVDCTVEPQRCPNRPVVMAAQPAAGKPVAPREQQRVAVPFHNGQRLLQVPVDATGLGRPPSREPLAVNVGAVAKPQGDAAPLPAGSPSRTELTALVATVVQPTKARNFESLKPFITQRLYDTLTPLLVKDGDRLWRHLDKYQTAADQGFKTQVDSVEMDKAQLHLTLPDGSELRPILARQNGVWKIDRF